ncbi:MAG TPA: hypothetical protein VNW90_10750 [Acetobacteraceae bacterium]|jgi:hypothetical protein|nr:hypothetical protein [Acetobacteraceae bacterium]
MSNDRPLTKESYWKPTPQLRWYWPDGINGAPRLQQLFERGLETEWREVPNVLPD